MHCNDGSTTHEEGLLPACLSDVQGMKDTSTHKLSGKYVEFTKKSTHKHHEISPWTNNYQSVASLLKDAPSYKKNTKWSSQEVSKPANFHFDSRHVCDQTHYKYLTNNGCYRNAKAERKIEIKKKIARNIDKLKENQASEINNNSYFYDTPNIVRSPYNPCNTSTCNNVTCNNSNTNEMLSYQEHVGVSECTGHGRTDASLLPLATAAKGACLPRARCRGNKELRLHFRMSDLYKHQADNASRPVELRRNRTIIKDSNVVKARSRTVHETLSLPACHSYLKCDLGRMAGVAERTTVSVDSAVACASGDIVGHSPRNRNHAHRNHRKLHEKGVFCSAPRLHISRDAFEPFDGTTTRIRGFVDVLMNRAITRQKTDSSERILPEILGHRIIKASQVKNIQ